MKPFLKNFGAFGIGCVLALLLLEGLLRIHNPFESRVRGDRIVLPVNKRYVFANQHIEGLDETILHTKNSLGFRGSEPPNDSLDGRLSIITVGGSTTECFYLSDGKTWPDLLQQKLEGQFLNLWLNNAGLNGHTTFGHLVLLRDHIARLHPKVVLYLVGANEVGNDFVMNSFELENVRGGIQFNSPARFVKSSAAYSEVISLALNLYRYGRARALGQGNQRVDLRAREQRPYPDPRLAAVLEEHRKKFVPSYARRLTDLVNETLRDSITPVLITQPVLYGDAVDDRTGVNLAGVMVDDYDGDTQWRILELYNDVTRRVAGKMGVYLIDLDAELPKSSNLFYDFVHYTNRGAEEVARIVYRHLGPYLSHRYSEFLRRQ